MTLEGHFNKQVVWNSFCMYLGTNTNGLVDKLKRERDRFIAFAFASADILMELDKSGKIIYIDGATKRLLDREPEHLINQNFTSLIHGDDSDLSAYLLNNDSKSRVDNIAIRLTTQNGQSYPFIMSGYKISELQGHYYLTFSTFRNDISMADVARRDLKTGLLRKGEFSLAINRQIMLSKFSEQVPFLTMIIIEAGHQLLETFDNKKFQEVSDLIKTASINGDSAGLIKDNIFGFVHDDSITPVEVKNQIATILGINAEVMTVKLDTLPDISEEDNVQAITHAFNKFCVSGADNMQYGSLLQFYDEMVGETVSRISEFKRTVEDQTFDLAFQPIVEVKTGIVAHFEVLTRLRDSKIFFNPFQFIEFGENIGLISDFDLKMTARVISILKELKVQGIRPNLSINLSGFSLSSRAFMDSLSVMLSEVEELCPQIIFEITESSRVSNARLANDFFKRLRSLGIKCCIDDFGAGEATFEYLRHFDVDIVKIDGSYITPDAIASTHGRHLLQALGRLCNDIGVDVVGEKVENAEAAAMLVEAGIKYGQGYFYAKPTTELSILKIQEFDPKLAKITNMHEWRKTPLL